MKNYNNEILNDCSWFAEKHRGKNKLSGAHWSTIIRFPKLFDEAIRLQKRVDALEDYIADYCSPIISDKYSETERQAQRIAELEHYKKLNEQWVKEKIDGLTTLEEIEKMVMIADRINKSNASIRCGWCDAEFETRDEVKEHAYGCKDNPLAQRIAELEQELDAVASDALWTARGYDKPPQPPKEEVKWTKSNSNNV